MKWIMAVAIETLGHVGARARGFILFRPSSSRFSLVFFFCFSSFFLFFFLSLPLLFFPLFLVSYFLFLRLLSPIKIRFRGRKPGEESRRQRQPQVWWRCVAAGGCGASEPTGTEPSAS
ncbi:hypothetical protein M441DRAFT_226659 [Trichoderma asperellum CBS 433.97]|uniref:Uncharacterized protein n=1 Tax=Trichoderma asperellum (strain ATCC 204424 / CBS 433.97 / NBRC 101777) TaxID=1042311 RepID=A0A2T3ZQ42_TRIA4|nr:hypothetical protein M441DRAFT_226659 [Trichoderma asperellum CBS 433.97]PTB46894.1 hypothetical protein M441DRAFT_226659 [Trichoderma asperellum CBS 433.97]